MVWTRLLTQDTIHDEASLSPADLSKGIQARAQAVDTSMAQKRYRVEPVYVKSSLVKPRAIRQRTSRAIVMAHILRPVSDGLSEWYESTKRCDRDLTVQQGQT